MGSIHWSKEDNHNYFVNMGFWSHWRCKLYYHRDLLDIFPLLSTKWLIWVGPQKWYSIPIAWIGPRRAFLVTLTRSPTLLNLKLYLFIRDNVYITFVKRLFKKQLVFINFASDALQTLSSSPKILQSCNGNTPTSVPSPKATKATYASVLKTSPTSQTQIPIKIFSLFSAGTTATVPAIDFHASCAKLWT